MTVKEIKNDLVIASIGNGDFSIYTFVKEGIIFKNL